MNRLHPIAQAVQSQGRGKDTQLVHMTPNEVASMQALAKANGGSLSINPNTGLPEAGFLDSMLPTILGVGLAAATGGTSLALSPAMIGLGIGGLQFARTGDLGKGLMAGLGAWGGAGLAGSLGLGAAGAAGGVGSGVTAAPAVNPSIQAADIGAQNSCPTRFLTCQWIWWRNGFKSSTKQLINFYESACRRPTPNINAYAGRRRTGSS
jgi:hypothetical protein